MLSGLVRSTVQAVPHSRILAACQAGPAPAPRISGTEVSFDDDGEIYLGMMPGSMKALDLLRDPRLALHCPTEDAPEGNSDAWIGDAKIAGLGVEVPAEGHHRFRIEVAEVVVTTVAGDRLVLRSWHPGRGVETRQRS